ncbi:MAG: dihydroorotate dehydrogenase electron transfer subunit [Atopobiaceae bacterium]|nr:dihydroorotate dehydrogenase electron transfer subunit [Atopobiaceae bacterium]
MSAAKAQGLKGTVGLHEFCVLSNEQVSRDTFRLEISSRLAQEIQPGQFMNFAVPGDPSHILRIPLSFSHADAPASTVTMYFVTVGEGTKRLSSMREGDISTVVGPCGKGWRLPEDPSVRCLLVSGGIGLAHIAAAAGMLGRAGIVYDVIAGFQTAARIPDRLISEMEPCLAPDARIHLATDDGTYGFAGFTTQLMEQLIAERSYGCVLTCGPEVMMRGVAAICAREGIACQASMERMMGCGFGACGACNIPLVAGGYASCCMDGPVFDAREVVW